MEKKCKIIYLNNFIYILSDDEIKKGDYRYSKIQNNVTLAVKTDINTNYYKEVKNYYFKVIATTDTSLTIDTKIFGKDRYKQLAQPSQQFIEKYIESYNKDSQIIDILVEYEQYCKQRECNAIACKIFCKTTYTRLKVNSKDNTVIIKKLKNSWNREEIIELLKDFELEIESAMDSDDDGNIFTNINVNNWINKKL